METKLTKPNKILNISFWEYVFEKEFKSIEKLLESKKAYQIYLLEKPLDEKSIKMIEKIKNEVGLIINLLTIIEKLKSAYLTATSSINSYLWELIIENECLKQELQIDEKLVNILIENYKIKKDGK